MNATVLIPLLALFAWAIYASLRARRYRRERDAADRHAQQLVQDFLKYMNMGRDTGEGGR